MNIPTYIYILTMDKSRQKKINLNKTFYKRTSFGIYNRYLYNNIYIYIGLPYFKTCGFVHKVIYTYLSRVAPKHD